MQKLKSIPLYSKWTLVPILALIAFYTLSLVFKDKPRTFTPEVYSESNAQLKKQLSASIKQLQQFGKEGGRFRIPFLRDCSTTESINGYCT